MWRNMVDPDMPQMTIICHRKYTIWMPDNWGRNTDTRPQWLRERAIMLGYTFIACPVELYIQGYSSCHIPTSIHISMIVSKCSRQTNDCCGHRCYEREISHNFVVNLTVFLFNGDNCGWVTNLTDGKAMICYAIFCALRACLLLVPGWRSDQCRLLGYLSCWKSFTAPELKALKKWNLWYEFTRIEASLYLQGWR
jgi:hypothetical protein